MTTKDFLTQAYRLDQRINAKIGQVASLNDLATKCTTTMSGMPGNPNKGKDTMAEAIAKIVDLQAEINADIDKLVDLKRDIVSAIKSVDDMELQTLLEKRYLCFKTWEQIAVEMGYTLRYVYKLRDKALKKVRFSK